VFVVSPVRDPAAYHAWYETPRGAWIGGREAAMLLDLMQPVRGESLLDLGCGTGWFSARFAAEGLQVTGLDPDRAALDFARSRYRGIRWVEGRGERLPFADRAFDHCTAVTSLCFVEDPAGVVREMWRVSRRSVTLGLLHRGSLLWLSHRGRGGYRGARWDRASDVRTWISGLEPEPVVRMAWGVYLPHGGHFARLVEQALPSTIALGSFLAVGVQRQLS
jgi:SAM-dependent methyltransferase